MSPGRDNNIIEQTRQIIQATLLVLTAFRPSPKFISEAARRPEVCKHVRDALPEVRYLPYVFHY